MDDTTWFWEIVDAQGLAEVSSDETVALREILNRSHRAEAEIEAIFAAIGSPRFMDPPDGGDVPVAEQVRRMRERLELVERVVRNVASWWSEDGRYAFNGMPDCIRAVGSALENGPADLADATKKDPGTEQREAGV